MKGKKKINSDSVQAVVMIAPMLIGFVIFTYYIYFEIFLL